MRRMIATSLAVLGLSASSLAGALRAPADAHALTESPITKAAEVCRHADETGDLKNLSITRADCVDSLIGPRTEQAARDIAALCAVMGVQTNVGATTTNQCIRNVEDLVAI
jgi:hypothetical protein